MVNGLLYLGGSIQIIFLAAGNLKKYFMGALY